MREIIGELLESTLGALEADALLLFRKDQEHWVSDHQLGVYRGQTTAYRFYERGMVSAALASSGRPVTLAQADVDAELKADFARIALQDAISIELPVKVESRSVLVVHAVEPAHFTERRAVMLEGLGVVLARALDRYASLRQGAPLDLAEESDRRFRAFMAALPANTWIKDAAGQYLFANDRTTRMFHRGRSMLGQTDHELMPPAVAAKVRADDLRVLEGRAVLIREEDIPTSDGALHTWLTTKFPIIDAQGEVSTGGMAFDITEQRATQREAEEARKQLPTIVELLHEPVVVFAEGVVLYANDAFWKLIGSAPLTDLKLTALIPADEHAAVANAEQRLKLGQLVDGERFIQRLDLAPPVRVEFSTRAMSYLGRPANLCVMHDVTAKHAAEERLQLTERLASVGTLAAGVAHEINNPLTYVCANLALLTEHLTVQGGQPLELARESLEGAERIARIVQGMRSFARPSARKQQAPVDLNDVVHHAVDLTMHLLRVRAQCEVNVSGLPLVLGDETALVQVLVNLLSNAAQSIPPGNVQGNRVTVSGRIEGTKVLIDVTDTGVGMTPEVRARIFDPFFTTKAVNEGTGLGLAISHGLVRSHDGELRVTSEPGLGTMFTLELPVPSTLPTLTQVLRPQPSREALRVLVVDDDKFVLNSFRRMLAGHEVELFDSGQEALARMSTEHFDLIICDVMMPGLGGAELVAQCPPDVADHMVMMTGGGSFDDEEQGPEGAHRTGRPVLIKPVSRSALQHLIEEARSRRQH